MIQSKEFKVKLEHGTYVFYCEIAKSMGRSVEEVLVDTLYKYAEIVVRKASKEKE